MSKEQIIWIGLLLVVIAAKVGFLLGRWLLQREYEKRFSYKPKVGTSTNGANYEIDTDWANIANLSRKSWTKDNPC